MIGLLSVAEAALLNLEFHLCAKSGQITVLSRVFSSDVKSSRPKWHRGQNYGLGLKALASASASNIWPRPVLDLVLYVIGHFSG